ncbi:MAG: (2Fe-2S)-binding protein [Anaerolineae bacterium]
MKRYTLSLHVNDDTYEVAVRPQWSLLEVLRDELELTGTNDGCRTGNCGACTVLLDGRPITSCLMLALDADGHQITTIEALSASGEIHPLQRSFVEHGAIQCGYCTPGMILSANTLLEDNPHPTETEVRSALIGNLCRCTGFAKIVEAVMAATEDG